MLLAQRDDGGAAAAATPLPPDRAAVSRADGDAVTLVEFLDYQCPACATHCTEITRELEDDYRGRLTFAPRHFPLAGHPLAMPAARAAEAAARQGKYAEMYHALYAGYDSWAVDGRSTADDLPRAVRVFEGFAASMGLDVERFRADMASPEVQAVIDRDTADGRALGVTGTPTFFVDGELFRPRGATAAEVDRELRARIDAELAG